MSRSKKRKLKQASNRVNADDGNLIPKQSAGYLNYESIQYSPNRSYIFATQQEDHRLQYTYSDRVPMLKISNYLENNFPQYGELINSVARFGIGRGIIINASTSNSNYNELADFTFDQWASNRFSDVEKSKNFYQFQRYVAERLVADGEVFVVLTKSDSGYPRLQAINPLRVRSSSDSDDDSIDGIYYDSKGIEPIAYNVFHLDDPTNKTSKSTYEKIDANDIIHIYNPVSSVQGHGIPWAQNSFSLMRDNADIKKYLINAVKNESLLSLQLQDTTGKGSPINIGGMVGKPYKAGPANPESNQPNNSNPAYMEQLQGNGLNRIVQVGPAEIKPILGNRPQQNVMEFCKLNIKDITSSMGLPYEFIYDPTELNNKGGDIIIDKARAFFAELQEILIDQFVQRVYGWVLSVQLNLADVRPLGNENPFSATFTCPQKVGFGRNDTNNAIDALNNGITTKKAYYGSLGQDWRSETDQWLLEEKYKQDQAAKMGVDLSKIVYGKGSVSLKQSETETDDVSEDDAVIKKDASK